MVNSDERDTQTQFTSLAIDALTESLGSAWQRSICVSTQHPNRHATAGRGVHPTRSTNWLSSALSNQEETAAASHRELKQVEAATG